MTLSIARNEPGRDLLRIPERDEERVGGERAVDHCRHFLPGRRSFELDDETGLERCRRVAADAEHGAVIEVHFYIDIHAVDRNRLARRSELDADGNTAGESRPDKEAGCRALLVATKNFAHIHHRLMITLAERAGQAVLDIGAGLGRAEGCCRLLAIDGDDALLRGTNLGIPVHGVISYIAVRLAWSGQAPPSPTLSRYQRHSCRRTKNQSSADAGRSFFIVDVCQLGVTTRTVRRLSAHSVAVKEISVMQEEPATSRMTIVS